MAPVTVISSNGHRIMGKFKRSHPLAKEGDVVEITARHCGKQQPRVTEGTMLYVLGVSSLKDGTVRLEVKDPGKKVERLYINAKRFDWRIVDRKEIFETEFKRGVHKDSKALERKFTMKEQMDIAFVPLVIETLIWHYADLCVEYCAENRISETLKLTRAVKQLKKNRENTILKDLSARNLAQVKSETQRFVQSCGNDFTILHFTVNREYIRHYPDMAYEKLVTYALTGMVLIRFLDHYNAKVFRMVKERLGKENRVDREPSINALYLSFSGFAGNVEKFNFKENQIALCMKILEIKLSQIEFNLTKD